MVLVGFIKGFPDEGVDLVGVVGFEDFEHSRHTLRGIYMWMLEHSVSIKELTFEFIQVEFHDLREKGNKFAKVN